MAGRTKQQISRIVVSDEKARSIISGELGDGDSHSLAENLGENLSRNHFGKSAVAIVVKKLHWLGSINVGMAITSADRVVPWLPVTVVRNEKVKVAVIVVVDPRRGDRP